HHRPPLVDGRRLRPPLPPRNRSRRRRRHARRGAADMSERRILVTGADGFIGSHLTEALVRRGERVRAFVLYNSFGSWGWLDHAPKEIRDSLDVFSGDVRDAY